MYCTYVRTCVFASSFCGGICDSKVGLCLLDRDTTECNCRESRSTFGWWNCRITCSSFLPFEKREKSVKLFQKTRLQLYFGSAPTEENNTSIFIFIFAKAKASVFFFFPSPDLGILLELPEHGEIFAPLPSFVLPFLCSGARMPSKYTSMRATSKFQPQAR